MTDNITAAAATKPSTAKHTASPFGLPKDEIPKFDLPKMEVPASFRERAGKGVAQAKENKPPLRASQTITSSSSRSPAPTPALFLTLPPSL